MSFHVAMPIVNAVSLSFQVGALWVRRTYMQAIDWFQEENEMKKLDPERAGPGRKVNGISKGKTEETKVIIKAMGCFGKGNYGQADHMCKTELRDHRIQQAHFTD